MLAPGRSRCCEIIDTGIGVAAADLSRIFERFQQSDSSATRKHQGLGVGLALSREIVIAHGGQIFATSIPGQGSTFTVRLNAIDAAALPVGSARVEESDRLTKLHRDAALSVAASIHATPVAEISSEALASVLVVDDEPDIQIFLSNVLSKEFAVRVAADGLAALKLVKEAPPAVLVIDMMMPGKTGLEVCRDLQTSQLATDTKILMLTARMDEQLKLAAIAAGASDFLNKPFSTAEVLARVRTLAQASGLQRSLRQRTREVEQAFQDLQAAESRLIQAEKMHALGGLAAGLLHEFNNPINHALMAVECGRALLAKLPQEAGLNLSASQKLVVNLTETLDDTQMSLERVGNIITDLRSFAYPESIDLKKSFELRTIVDSAVRFVSHELSEVALTIDVPMALQAVGAPSHITQVFVNILLNAVAATQATKTLRPPEIQVVARDLGERIQITIRDNGTGIPGDVLAHVFDPFFTTKQVGDGIGLGLSICHTIMQQHGQAISIDTQVGEYTTFCFELAKSTEGAVRYEYVH
ncbi:MAG TPA: ATP-binding protein [Pirellulaceae bacterium]|nr:ATP-binding protein [Pirellulaceae bacterium]